MSRVKVYTGFGLLLLSFLLMLPAIQADTSTVYVIPIEDEVERGLQAFIERGIEEAEDAGAEAIIFEIDTPGGFVDAADGIARLLNKTQLETMAFVNQDALSAGAFLALHNDEIYMHPNGRMGAAQVIDQAGNAAADKANSAWLASMKNAAQTAGRDPEYALAMADASMALPELGVAEGELLTLGAQEAEQVGYSQGTVSSLGELLALKGYENASVVTVDETFSESLARFLTNPIVVPILLSIAGLGLLLELFTPGVGIPGIIGLSSLLLFFYGHLVAGLAGYESIILLVIGFGLLVAEFIIPGGVAGFLGIAAILGSILLAGGDLKSTAIAVLIAMIVATVGMVIVVKFFGKRLDLFKRIILTDATDTESGYVSTTNRPELVGKIARTVTALRPSGTIKLDDERIDAVSEGRFIDNGKDVKIIKVEGSRIVVRELEKQEEE
ncbi:nodulation protein NfeD [Microbacterium sp. APC 3898]|uniref:Nodulation protein NfeD n=2 Tax=Planococcus TaxID=1372 RepID=A0ABT7ZIF4_9BACL|nr:MULTISPECIES: nodulation protein NfeD [Terrabacteria group]MBD8015738.1 nodulation protein NfeD [Planococcus wigleyi]MDN3426857.1 nodulation protein NfeD [Planococcus sp. APC 4016]MDN3499995.1 nodulation protein NfeD [Microbacterium sp. APC 3898]